VLYDPPPRHKVKVAFITRGETPWQRLRDGPEIFSFLNRTLTRPRLLVCRAGREYISVAVAAFCRSLLESKEPAIRKSYRKEMKITTKSESIAKVYVIENEVVR